MTKVEVILQALSQSFPNAKSELNFSSPFELLVAVILSAQCTDKRVNQVTPQLFEVASTPQQLADLPIEQIESIIKPCGFYHNKAQFLKQAATDIVARFDGQVPKNIDDLRTLAGVGRKTANVVYAVAFGGQAIAVDTHVFRVSNRLGIAKGKTPLEVEKQLMQAIDSNNWSHAHHLILLHGRYVCRAQRPNCTNCNVRQHCQHFTNNEASIT